MAVSGSSSPRLTRNKHFARFFAKIDRLGASYAIVGMDGVVRAAVGSTQASGTRFVLGQDLSQTPMMRLVRSDRDARVIDEDLTGRRHMITARRVSGYPLAVLVSVDEQEVYKESAPIYEFILSPASCSR